MFRIPIHVHKQFCMYGFLGRAAAFSGGRRTLQNHILDASTGAQHRGAGLEIEVQLSKKFFGSREGMEVCWNPIQVLHAPGNLCVEVLQRLAESEAEFVEKASCVRRVDVTPKSTDLWKAVYMLPGEYLCRRFCSQMFRGNPRMLLYVVPLDEGGEPKTDVECPTYGYFLEKEIERLGGPAELEKMRSPILCRFGAAKTTPTKRKDRKISIASTPAV